MWEVDITLDPFPCNGGTTSCEALWMGLPLISMETDSYMGRQGASYLVKLGLDDFIARDTEAYVEKAVQLAADTHVLRPCGKPYGPKSSLRFSTMTSTYRNLKRPIAT